MPPEVGPFDDENLQTADPEVYKWVSTEQQRQENTLEMIASENHVSPAVMAAVGSCLTNKYCEGYPGARYYAGCEYYDRIEDLAVLAETFDPERARGIVLDGITDTSYFTSRNNKFQSNNYTLEYSNQNFQPFKWIGGAVSVSVWKSKGMDTNGTFNWQ